MLLKVWFSELDSGKDVSYLSPYACLATKLTENCKGQTFLKKKKENGKVQS